VIALGLALLAAPAWADPPATGLVPEGERLLPMDGGTGVQVGEQVVVGPDGGMQALTVGTRIRLADDVVVGGALPWTTFPVPGGRDRSLGNARLWAAWRLPLGALREYAGIAVHFDAGGSATPGSTPRRSCGRARGSRRSGRRGSPRAT